MGEGERGRVARARRVEISANMLVGARVQGRMPGWRWADGCRRGSGGRQPITSLQRMAESKTQPINRLEDAAVERGLSIVPNRNIF